MEETSNCIALDGIMFEGCNIRIRRPADYNAAAAAALVWEQQRVQAARRPPLPLPRP